MFYINIISMQCVNFYAQLATLINLVATHRKKKTNEFADFFVEFAIANVTRVYRMNQRYWFTQTHSPKYKTAVVIPRRLFPSDKHTFHIH